MDYGARSEVISCAMSPLPSQSRKISDSISQRIGLRGSRNRVRYQSFKLTTANYRDRNREKTEYVRYSTLCYCRLPGDIKYPGTPR